MLETFHVPTGLHKYPSVVFAARLRVLSGRNSLKQIKKLEYTLGNHRGLHTLARAHLDRFNYYPDSRTHPA